MSVPVATERKSYLPLRLRPTGIVGPRIQSPMPSVSETNNKTSLIVGNRVVVNGLKSGTLRYIGPVQFAQGIFCGVELDQPDGKHDGQVKDTRYFQCAPNHGVFVPQDKVALAPRIRVPPIQKPISRLKPPSMTRSTTLTSPINQTNEPEKPVQLPDIVPNSTPQPVTTVVIASEQPKEEIIIHTIEPKLDIQPLQIDESPETIEADFTASVSLILHQLQQKEEQQNQRHTSSITISEEDTDDDDEDEDGLETASIVESTVDEKIDQTRHSSISSVFIPIDLTKSIQTDVSFNSNDNITFSKVEIPIQKKKTIVQPIKKNVERKPSVPSAIHIAKRPVNQKPSIVPPKKGTISKPKQATTSLPSQSKLSLSLSSCNSLNSSQSDVVSINKTSTQIADTNQDKSQVINQSSASSEKIFDESHHILTTRNQSLETNNQQLRKNYHHLLNQFELMMVLNQFCLNENEQIQQQHKYQLAKVQKRHEYLQNSIEQLQLTHKNDISLLDKQYQIQIETYQKSHQHQLHEYQQKTEQLLHEKTELESRCLLLQEKVDSFLTEMANSEHADVLLCHVETLEKDRTSLQTVLELKNKEVTQLRTKLNEQEIKLCDEQALQKRIIMAENRIQDLEWLLREKQLSEKAAVIERDGLKERTSQLERDNGQLKFENETLRYRLGEQSPSISIPMDNPIVSVSSVSPPQTRIRYRSYSFSYLVTDSHENERLTRSFSSLNCILYR